MADVLTPAQRSKNMGAIKGKGTGLEADLKSAMNKIGLRPWCNSRYNKELPGKPDFIFVSSRIAVFADGCFWHMCPRPGHCKIPSTNRQFWKNKLERNRERDKEVSLQLRKLGWRVIRVWGHEDLHKAAVRIKKKLERME